MNIAIDKSVICRYIKKQLGIYNVFVSAFGGRRSHRSIFGFHGIVVASTESSRFGNESVNGEVQKNQERQEADRRQARNQLGHGDLVGHGGLRALFGCR